MKKFVRNPSIIISYGSWAAKHVLLCAWRKSGTGCSLNSPLAPACFQHFGQLPVACKRSAISPLSNLVLAAYHRSDDQITWLPPGYESKFKPSNSIARSMLLQKCFAISFSLVYARSNPVSLHFLHSLYLFFFFCYSNLIFR